MAMVKHCEPGVFGNAVVPQPFELSEVGAKSRHPGQNQLRQRDQVSGSVPTSTQSQPPGKVSHPRTGSLAIKAKSVWK